MDDPQDPDRLRQAGLVYVSDREPGITRRKRGRGFSYHLPTGEALSDASEKARVARLAIPPAYRSVWICALAEGHLQATGYDDRGRKQYRYHALWQALRDEQKFDQLIAFGHALPALRRHVLADAQRLATPERATLAALVLLLDATHLRVGNRQYLAENGTFGATTLLKRHVRFGEGLELQFLAKGGKKVRRHLRAPRLQKILEGIADLPGANSLFGRMRRGRCIRSIQASSTATSAKSAMRPPRPRPSAPGAERVPPFLQHLPVFRGKNGPP